MPVLAYARPSDPVPPLRLGYLSPHDPGDRQAFSGSSHHAARALREAPGVELRILGHDRRRGRLDRLLRRSTPEIDVTRLPLDGLDAVVGLAATPLLLDLARHRPDLPYIHVTDATPAYLRETYGWKLPWRADADETRVAEGALATAYSSAAIAARAAGDLGLPGFAPAVIPFGMNLDARPVTPPRKPPLDTLQLLIVCTDWARKGGDIALAALDELRASGRAAELTVVGAMPAGLRNRPGVRHVGYLDKNRPRDLARLTALYATSHLLLLPTRADCTPMVVAEAMAFGTPVLASDTGGLGAMIAAPGAGLLLPLHAAPEDWAEAVCAATCDATGYAMRSDASFEVRLDWTSWARAVTALYHTAWNARVQRDLKAAVSS